MKKVAVLGEETFIRFFELIGAVGFPCKTPEEIRKKVNEIIKSEEYSLIIIPERFIESVRDIKEKLMREEKVEPIFAFFPDFVELEEKRIKELKREIMLAIGVEMKV